MTDRREYTAKVIGVDTKSDIAVIKINAKDLPVVKIGDSRGLKVGEWVLAIGAPFGFENSATAGIVSAKGRTLDSGMTDNVGIYASVAINCSGSPVVAYYTEPFDILKVLVCNNATCGSYSSQNVDPNSIRGPYPSLALDASGFPVVSYYDQSGGNLNVVHCGNATCSTVNTIFSPDGASADVGKYTSLRLDASGFPSPVIARSVVSSKAVSSPTASATTSNPCASLAPIAASPPARPPAAPPPGRSATLTPVRERYSSASFSSRRVSSATCAPVAPFCGPYTRAASRNVVSTSHATVTSSPASERPNASTAASPPSVDALPPTATMTRLQP
jgi:hypothetical protein